MGKIQVGQKRPKTVDMGGFTVAPNDSATVEKKDGMTAEEKNARADEANELSEKLAGLNGEITEHSDMDSGESQAQSDAGETSGDTSSADLSEILRSKPGRPKKSDGQ